MAEFKMVNTKTMDDKDAVIVVFKPSAKQLRDAQIVASNTFAELVKSKTMVRAKLDEYMVEQGLWDDKKEQELKDLSKKINEGERKLAAGGAGGFKKSEARQLALDMRDWRVRQTELLTSRRQLDEWTVEGQVENTRFDYLVSVCSNWQDKKPIFESLENYRDRATEPYAVAAAEALAEMMYKIDDKWIYDLPENKFLQSNKFVDEELRLINKDGKLVNREGKLINKEGRFIDEAGKFVDVNGNPVDEQGNAVVEFVEFAPED